MKRTIAIIALAVILCILFTCCTAKPSEQNAETPQDIESQAAAGNSKEATAASTVNTVPSGNADSAEEIETEHGSITNGNPGATASETDDPDSSPEELQQETESNTGTLVDKEDSEVQDEIIVIVTGNIGIVGD